MPRDRSLDEFLHGETTEDDASDPPDGSEPAEAAEPEAPAPAPADPDSELVGEPEPPTDPAPARATYDWTPDGATCSDCGETVRRRWRAAVGEDAPMVCADCKEW